MTEPRDPNEPQELIVKIPLFQQKELARDVKEQGKLLIRLEERLERMDHDLFGNGQPGKIQVLEKQVGTLTNAESHLKGWVAGVLALAMLIGGFAEFLYHIKH